MESTNGTVDVLLTQTDDNKAEKFESMTVTKVANGWVVHLVPSEYDGHSVTHVFQKANKVAAFVKTAAKELSLHTS